MMDTSAVVKNSGRLKELEKENKELQDSQRDFRKASAYFAQAELYRLDAINQALGARLVVDGLIHHSGLGSQYPSFPYSERLTDVGIETSVGSKGDSYGNALAETINMSLQD